MASHIEWFTENKDGRVQINSIAIYRELSSELVEKIDNNLSVNEIINWIRNKTKEAFRGQYSRNPEVGALNNAVGRWNEFIAMTLLSEIVLHMNQETEVCSAIFSLPNSRLEREETDRASSKFLSLFSKDEFAPEKTLEKLTSSKNKIFLPSPDYIIVTLKNKDVSKSVQSFLEQQAKEPHNMNLYKFLKGNLHIEEVKAAVSLKTSNRPDRRYQPLFEAAMIKSMGYVLQQGWKYYMVASNLSDADRTIFSKAIAPHGVALQQNFSLVDGTYLYARKEDLVPLVEAAIKQ